jgi:hypothetical protein
MRVVEGYRTSRSVVAFSMRNPIRALTARMIDADIFRA